MHRPAHVDRWLRGLAGVLLIVGALLLGSTTGANAATITLTGRTTGAVGIDTTVCVATATTCFFLGQGSGTVQPFGAAVFTDQGTGTLAGNCITVSDDHVLINANAPTYSTLNAHLTGQLCYATGTTNVVMTGILRGPITSGSGIYLGATGHLRLRVRLAFALNSIDSGTIVENYNGSVTY